MSFTSIVFPNLWFLEVNFVLGEKTNLDRASSFNGDVLRTNVSPLIHRFTILVERISISPYKCIEETQISMREER